MCFKYEEQYDAGCWDFLEWGISDNCPECKAELPAPDCIVRLLEEFYDVQFHDVNKFMDRMLRFFEELHEKGIIKPKKGIVDG